MSLLFASSFVGWQSANAQTGPRSGQFSTVLLWPKVADWNTSTDASARDSGSNSVIDVIANQDRRVSDPGVTFSGTLGKVDGRNGPVGFVRATTDVNVDANRFDSIAVTLGAENPALVMTILLQDASQAGTSEWFEITVNQPRGLRPGVGLYSSGTSIVRFADFKRFLRGVEVAGPPINAGAIRKFGIQLARSVQPAILRDGGDIPFRVVLATTVPAINTTKESIAPQNVETAILGLEQKSIARARQILEPEELALIKTATDQLFARFFPRRLTSQELDQVFGSPIVFNTVAINLTEGGTGRPLPEAPDEFFSQERLDSLADIRSVMLVPDLTKIWLRSLIIDFALRARPNRIIDDNGELRLSSDAFREYLDSRLRSLGYRTKIKSGVFQQPDGSFGLSQDLIIALGKSVVFDQSPFAVRVGEFSFPMIALYYASVLAEIPESQKLSRVSVPSFFSAITGNAQANQFQGWRLWQRMFANQDMQVAGSINSLDWWRVLLEGALTSE